MLFAELIYSNLLIKNKMSNNKLCEDGTGQSVFNLNFVERELPSTEKN